MLVKVLRVVALFCMLVPPLAAVAGAASIEVSRPWARATPPGASVGGVYFDIENAGPADTLVKIESPLVGRIEVHSMNTEHGVMSMRAVGALEILAHARVRLAPGGLHAMLFDLRRPLVEGERLPLRLVFAHAGILAVDAVVAAPGALEPPALSAARDARVATASPFRLAVWPSGARQPQFELQDVDGRRRTLDDYHGRVVVVFFGFVSCPEVCPAELFKLARVMKRLGAASRGVQVLFVTLDPRRDSREVLRHYVTSFDSRFVGLTGSAAQIDAAAAQFAVEYSTVREGAGYTIDHSVATFLFDAAGHLRLVGSARTGVEDFVHDLEVLQSESPGGRG